MQSINVAYDNSTYKSINGILYDINLKAIIRFPPKCNITTFTIPNSVTTIKNGSFHGCSSLNTIIIPNSVTFIGCNAFRDCTSLRDIDLPNSIISIDKNAFYGCSSLITVNIPYNISVISKGLFDGCSSLKTIDIHHNITSIERNAFRDCTSLQVVDLPYSITDIDSFVGCSSLQSINVADDNSTYKSVRGILYNKSQDTLIRVPPKYNDTCFYIPFSVVSIEDFAFEGCHSLQSINIPDEVTYIGDCVFEGCHSLQSIVIPNYIKYIGECLFMDCTSLHTVDIPNSITDIATCAFSDCPSLTNIFMRCQDVDNLDICEDAFDNDIFEKCILHIPSGTRWEYSHHPLFGKFKNIIADLFN